MHGLSCKRSNGRSTRHRQLNDIIWRALKRAAIAVSMEPAGLVRGDATRPDGLTLVPWQGGTLRSLIHWPSPTFRLTQLFRLAAARKHVQYDTTHIFVPVAVESLGSFCDEDLKFVSEKVFLFLRSRIILENPNFLFQKISVLLQRFNEVGFSWNLSRHKLTRQRRLTTPAHVLTLFVTLRIYRGY